MTSEEQIEEILMEADAYGLRFEVLQTAKQLLDDGYERVNAFELAFLEWVK